MGGEWAWCWACMPPPCIGLIGMESLLLITVIISHHHHHHHHHLLVMLFRQPVPVKWTPALLGCGWFVYLVIVFAPVIICTFIINCAIYNYNRHSVIWKYSPQNNPRPIAINRDFVDTSIVHLHIHRHDSVWFDLTITIHINFDWKSHYFQFWKS